MAKRKRLDPKVARTYQRAFETAALLHALRYDRFGHLSHLTILDYTLLVRSTGMYDLRRYDREGNISDKPIRGEKLPEGFWSRYYATFENFDPILASNYFGGICHELVSYPPAS